MVKILLGSDLHTPTSKVGKFKAMMNHAKSQGIEHVIVCGDMTNGKSMGASVADVNWEQEPQIALKEYSEKLNEHLLGIYRAYTAECEKHSEIDVDFLLGNHDTVHAKELGQRLRQGQIWERNGLKFYTPGQNSKTGPPSKALLANIPEQYQGKLIESLSQLFPHTGANYVPLGALDTLELSDLEEKLKESPLVGGEFKDQQFDFALTHEAAINEHFQAPYEGGDLTDPELYCLMKQGRVKNVALGHAHSGLIQEANGVLGLRPGGQYVYELDVSDNGKVKEVIVYQFKRA